MHVHGLPLWNFVDAPTQRVKRNVNKTVDPAVRDLGIGASVEQCHASVAWELFYVVPEELPDLARNDVFGNKPHHIDRVFGRAEGWRVAKLQLGKVCHLCDKGVRVRYGR